MPHAPMDRPRHADMVISRPALLAAASLALFALAVAVVSTVFGLKAPTVVEAPAVAERMLVFEQLDAGEVRVVDAETGAELAHLAEAESGFVLNVLRGFGYARRREGVAADAPYRLVRHGPQRISMEDPSTGRRFRLHAHGQLNMAVFQPLVPAPDLASVAPLR